MKWLIVVIFATIQGDVYIFTDPTFDSREECLESIKNPVDQIRYTEKLVMEYKRLLPILALNCLDEKTIKDVLDSVGEEKV